MKRIVLTISIVISIVGLLVMASPTILRLTGYDHAVKKYIISRVLKADATAIDVDEFRIGLGLLELRQVKIETPDKRLDIFIPAIRFDIFLHQFLLHPTRPQLAIKAIRFIEPRVVITLVGTNPDKSIKDTPRKPLYKLLADLNKIEGIEQVHIENGTIAYQNQNGKQFGLAENVRGNLTIADIENIKLQLQVSIASTENTNCIITGTANLPNKHMTAGIEFLEYRLDRVDVPELAPGLKIQSGILSGAVQVEYHQFNLDSIELFGNLQVRDLAANYYQRTIDSLDLNIRLDKRLAEIYSGRGRFEEAIFNVTGDCNDIARPAVRAVVRFDTLGLKAIAGDLNGRFDNLKLTLNVSPEGMFNSKIRARRWQAGTQLAVQDIRGAVSLANGKALLEDISGRFDGIDLAARGLWDTKNENLELNLTAQARSGQHVLFDRMTNQQHLAHLKVNWNRKPGKINGSWDYLIGQKDTLMYFGGILAGNPAALTVKLKEAFPQGPQARLTLENLFGRIKISDARLINFPFSELSSNSALKKAFERFSTDMQLSGDVGRLKANIEVTDRENKNNDFRLNANLVNIFTNHKTFKGVVELKNLLGFYDFSLAGADLTGNFNFPAGVQGDLHVTLVEDGPVSGSADFNGFCLTSAFSDSIVAGSEDQMSGNISLSGTIQNPEIQARLSADRFVFNNVGYYRTDVAVHANTEHLVVDSLTISVNNLPLIDGNFTWQFNDGSLVGNFSGSDVDMDNITRSINLSNGAITGMASYALSLGGTIRQPKIASSGTISDGTLYGTDFKKLDFHFTDQIADSGVFYDPAAHRIVISDLSMHNPGEYSLESKGNFPLHQNQPLDVTVHFRGDALAFLPKVDKFFEGGTSIADIRLHIGGTRSQLRFISGICEIDRGELWLKQVAPHIEDIHGTIELKEGTNQVSFKNLTARIGDQRAVFNTVRHITTSGGRMLQPWYFKNLDLDFGVLSIKTDKPGLELNLPGLMEPEDSGKLYLTGNSEGEPFYFAGPVKHPLAIGTLTLYDARMTYPFILPQHKSHKPSIAVQFLSNMDWDVLMRSGEDVVYKRKIPAYIDQVDAEVFVDESSPGLHFSGIISNNSFRVVGKLSSNRGRLEYLDQNFKVETFSVEFPQWDVFPLVSGRAWTTIRDSIEAVPKTIYLRLYAEDENTQQETAQGSWDQFRFKLESADPQVGEDQERVLSYLGFTVGNIREKATSVGGSITERYLIRPLLRPIERALEQNLGVDMVRINSNIAKNLFRSSFGYNSETNLFFDPFGSNVSYLFLMQSSDITIGKYLSKDLFLTYTGQLVSVYNQNQPELDLNHSIGIEYRFLRNVLVEFEYDRELMRYYRLTSEKQYLNDFKIRFRHSFTF